jgi:hypothetical protein
MSSLSSIVSFRLAGINASEVVHPLHLPSLMHRLQGLQSSHRVLALLHSSHAAATRFPEATRCALRMALLKELLFLSASMGTVGAFFFPMCLCSFALFRWAQDCCSIHALSSETLNRRRITALGVIVIASRSHNLVPSNIHYSSGSVLTKQISLTLKG